MKDIKVLAEDILQGLMGDSHISDILLRTKIFANMKGDKQLGEWVQHELEGYEDQPPSYRILDAAVKVDVFVPFRGTARIKFPIDVIKEEKVRERFSKMPFHNSISEIESMTTEDGNGTLQCQLPAMVCHFISPFLNGDIQDAFQYVSKAAAHQIVVSVKSILIDYLLKIRESEDIDFLTFLNNQNNKTIMVNNTTNNYNAAIINTGDGTVNAQGSTNVVGNDNNTGVNAKVQLNEILSKIEKLIAQVENKDLHEAVSDARNMLNSEEKPTGLKYCLKAISNYVASIGAGVIANGLTPLVKDAMALLTLL